MVCRHLMHRANARQHRVRASSVDRDAILLQRSEAQQQGEADWMVEARADML